MNRFLIIILYLIFIIFFTFTYINNLYARITEIDSGYKLYKERINNICGKYKDGEKIVYKIEKEDEYEDYTKSDYYMKNSFDMNISFYDYIENASYKYKKIMNNIYKCGIIGAQQKSLNLIKKDLSENPIIKDKIEKKIRKTELTSKSFNCQNISNEKNSLHKKRILHQTTYELCKYHSYLEYLRKRSNIIVNVVPINKEIMSIKEVNDLMRKKQNEIDVEIEKVYKIFPIAFDTYTQYENNYTIHILLELLKDDFVDFRKKLHKTINPINQVVYKISNAMKD